VLFFIIFSTTPEKILFHIPHQISHQPRFFHISFPFFYHQKYVMANYQYEMAFEKSRQNYKKHMFDYNFGWGKWKKWI
jgi:hypothetical protein